MSDIMTSILYIYVVGFFPSLITSTILAWLETKDKDNVDNKNICAGISVLVMLSWWAVFYGIKRIYKYYK